MTLSYHFSPWINICWSMMSRSSAISLNQTLQYTHISEVIIDWKWYSALSFGLFLVEVCMKRIKNICIQLLTYALSKNTCHNMPIKYSRVLNKYVGLNKHIGRKMLENQIIVLVGINMLVRWSSKSIGWKNELVWKGKRQKL